MTPQNRYEGISHVVQLNSDYGKPCEHCSFPIGSDLSAFINHYINEHGYKLLHVGQETARAEGNLFQLTVALVGK